MHDFKLPPRSELDLRSSGILRSVDWWSWRRCSKFCESA